MVNVKNVVFLIAVLSAFFVPTAVSQQAACNSYTFPENNAVKYQTCVDLPVLSSSLHWTYDQSKSVASIAFRRSSTSSSRWISWGINPSGKGMVGTQALIAHQNSSTGSMIAYAISIGSYRPTLDPTSLSFGVSGFSATLEGDVMTIFATLQLAANTSTVNQVWQEGPLSGAGFPAAHSMSGPNLLSVGTLDLLSGVATGGSNSRQNWKNIHGVLNAVSWGTLMPIGVLLARYLKVFKSAGPAWFHLHRSCQLLAYLLGVAGWAIGMAHRRGGSSGTNSVHGKIGVALFTMATVQVLALFLRPKPDHKYRTYWNIYHKVTGYAVIALSVFNVLKGLDILDPSGKWRTAYIVVISIIGTCFVVLEAVTWGIVIKSRKAEADEQNLSRNNIEV